MSSAPHSNLDSGHSGATEQVLHALEDRGAGTLELVGPALVARSKGQHAILEAHGGRSGESRADRDFPRERRPGRRRRLTPDDVRDDAGREVLKEDHLGRYYQTMRLVLASASARRAELLASAGFAFDVAPADVDETPRSAEAPSDYALRVAREKARAVAERTVSADRPILAADTVVVSRLQILGKPADEAQAREMLRLLSGNVHEVLTAVVFLMGAEETAEVVTTRVRFISLTESEIDWYLATGEPQGKAGAYAIQGHAARFVDWIEGSWSNVVGLPVAAVYRILKDAGMLS